jgi:hypothetical protein
MMATNDGGLSGEADKLINELLKTLFDFDASDWPYFWVMSTGILTMLGCFVVFLFSLRRRWLNKPSKGGMFAGALCFGTGVVKFSYPALPWWLVIGGFSILGLFIAWALLFRRSR